jgi:hypothetical protein
MDGLSFIVRRAIGWGRFLVPALSLSGCVFGENQQFFSARAPGVPSIAGARRDLFRVGSAGAPKIDVLFCVDNSASMADNQLILADSFRGFIGNFFSAALDFHIGIITSDVDSGSASVWKSRMPGYPGANRGLLLSRDSSERFLNPESTELVSRFEENAMVGTAGSYREQCLNSFIYSMDPALLAQGAWNEGFFRSDALLALVVVSDENEDIQDGETVAARVGRLRSRIQALQGAGGKGSRFDFIINEQAPDPGRILAPGSIQYYPGRYYEAANILSGRTYDITQDFSADLLRISEGMVTQALSEFALSGRPKDASTIQVTLDGELLLQDAPDGFIYHPDRNTIELMGRAANPNPGAELQVSYLPMQ